MSFPVAIVARRPRVGPVVLALALTPVLAYGAVHGLGEALAYMLPPLLLLAAFVLRRYPGERTLLALMRPRHRSRLRDGTAPLAPRRGPRVVGPRGGELLARRLAVRPPPRPALASRSFS
jgi:hypothetical protein